MNKTSRKKNTEIALGYNSLDQGEPSKYCLELLNEYVEGRLTPEEVTDKLINKHEGKV